MGEIPEILCDDISVTDIAFVFVVVIVVVVVIVFGI